MGNHGSMAGCSIPTQDLDDLAQDVWTKIIEDLHRIRSDPKQAHFTTWLYTLVHNTVIDIVRRAIQHPTESLPPRIEVMLVDRVADLLPYRGELHVDLPALLEQLRDQVSGCTYLVFCMHWIEQHTIREIATALRMTPHQVRGRLYRGLLRFRALVRNDADDLG